LLGGKGGGAGRAPGSGFAGRGGGGGRLARGGGTKGLLGFKIPLGGTLAISISFSNSGGQVGRADNATRPGMRSLLRTPVIFFENMYALQSSHGVCLSDPHAMRKSLTIAPAIEGVLRIGSVDPIAVPIATLSGSRRLHHPEVGRTPKRTGNVPAYRGRWNAATAVILPNGRGFSQGRLPACSAYLEIAAITSLRTHPPPS
jgi:hypothetical protein